jgi:hypothetical protein
MHRFLISSLFGIFMLLTTSATHAENVLERVLANPKIQALLGRPTEIVNSLKLCEDTRYRSSNQQLCTEAQQAAMVNRLPFEMRTLMSNQKSAQSLRDICLAVQNTTVRDSYLCSELAKSDKDFANALQYSRIQSQPREDNTR